MILLIALLVVSCGPIGPGAVVPADYPPSGGFNAFELFLLALIVGPALYGFIKYRGQ